MSPEAVLSLCLLVPFLYAGLYLLTDPAKSIQVVNKVRADSHRLEAGLLWGSFFAEPKPIMDSWGTRICLRLAGVAVVAAGLFRLYSL
jgi:hypothetical protein